MNVLAIKADGDYCPVESYRNGGPWVPSDETDITKTFAREVAKLRSVQPHYESAYDEVTRDDWMVFGGFKS